MLKEILQLVLKELDYNRMKSSDVEKKILQITDEISELEIERAQALAYVERWGDINDKSHWRTVEYNRIGRVIEAKKDMIRALKQNL